MNKRATTMIMNAIFPNDSVPPITSLNQGIVVLARVAMFSAIVYLHAHTTAHAQNGSLNLVNSFEAVPSTGWTPCDPIVAAGPSSLVTMVNSRIIIFNKTGAKLFEQNLGGANSFWGTGATVAEPWVIFDPNSQRFIASSADFGGAKGVLYLAVSKTAAPTKSTDWNKYALNRSGTHHRPGLSGVATYPDDAKVGVDGDAIYITSIHFAKDPSITEFSHAELFALEKSSLLSGGPIQFLHDEPVITNSYSPWIAFKIHPAIVFGPAPAMYFVQSLLTRPDDKIVVHALSGVLTGNGTRTVSLVPVASYDRPPLVPQRGSSILLENIDERLMSAVVRNGALWTSHAVLDAAVGSESLVRWYQFDVTGLPFTAARLLQSGTVHPGPGIHTWLPSINVDASGNMGLSFSVGSASQYAAIGYTGRLATDPYGWTASVRTARGGDGSYTAGGWGEYSGLAIDPDGSTFWLCNEYPTKQKKWQTFVAGFQIGN